MYLSTMLKKGAFVCVFHPLSTFFFPLGSSDSFEDISERDYENVVPSHLLRWQQPGPQLRAKPGNKFVTTQNHPSIADAPEGSS